MQIGCKVNVFFEYIQVDIKKYTKKEYSICSNQKNIVPLPQIPTLEGNMSCEKCFVGRFLTY